MNGPDPLPLAAVLATMAADMQAGDGERAPWARDRIGVQRQPLPAGMRRAVLVRDGFTCQWCAIAARGNGVLLEIDHIVPWSAGGADHPVNLRTLCEPCNQRRSNRVTGREARALPISLRCRRCETDEAGAAAFITAFCLTCKAPGATPYLADLMLGGPIPTAGVIETVKPDPVIGYRPGFDRVLQVLRGRVAALVVTCPWCHAEPGEPCAGINGYPLVRSAAHPARMDLS